MCEANLHVASDIFLVSPTAVSRPLFPSKLAAGKIPAFDCSSLGILPKAQRAVKAKLLELEKFWKNVD